MLDVRKIVENTLATLAAPSAGLVWYYCTTSVVVLAVHTGPGPSPSNEVYRFRIEMYCCIWWVPYRIRKTVSPTPSCVGI